MTDTFQPQAVKLHYHGETFDTKQEIHEISDAWLIAADVVGMYSDDGLVFYDTDRLEKRAMDTIFTKTTILVFLW
ncbi:hypothetical protein QKW34_07555 [Bacillus licheniformis]|nr:hypothetical protein QKW34_07555 [Bacillus licheniformis]